MGSLVIEGVLESSPSISVICVPMCKACTTPCAVWIFFQRQLCSRHVPLPHSLSGHAALEGGCLQLLCVQSCFGESRILHGDCNLPPSNSRRVVVTASVASGVLAFHRLCPVRMFLYFHRCLLLSSNFRSIFLIWESQTDSFLTLHSRFRLVPMLFLISEQKYQWI
jgi:hypothetical protein